MNQNDYLSIGCKSIKKPKKLLLHKFVLGAYSYDLYGLILLSVKNDFDKKFFALNPFDIRRDIIRDINTSYSFTKSQLCELFDMSNKVIHKKNSNGVFFLICAIQELRRSEITVYNSLKNNVDFRVTGLINNGNYDDGVLTVDIDPYICYELVEYAHNGGFSLIDKDLFWKLRNPVAKKIFELISSDKRKCFKCNLFDYLYSVCEDFDPNDFNQRVLIQKYLKRPIDSLLKESNGLIVKVSDKDYEFSRLSGLNGNAINESTVLQFNLMHKEIDIERRGIL
jgi:hypothetical protein